MASERPPRSELFAFYYLGFNPEGEYRFANVHHIARYYNVSHDTVTRWLEQLELQPSWVLRQNYDLPGAQLELQLDAPSMTPPEILKRIDKILEELDAARGGRRFWEEKG